jgi:hypothetical protein
MLLCCNSALSTRLTRPRLSGGRSTPCPLAPAPTHGKGSDSHAYRKLRRHTPDGRKTPRRVHAADRHMTVATHCDGRSGQKALLRCHTLLPCARLSIGSPAARPSQISGLAVNFACCLERDANNDISAPVICAGAGMAADFPTIVVRNYSNWSMTSVAPANFLVDLK